jgi:hypothetical protein
MTMSRRGLIAAAGLLVPAGPSLAQDRLPPVSVRRSELTVSRSLAVARPDLPVPSDSGMLFYVQHAINKNVLVYAARQRPDGGLDPQAPVEVFWRRYDDDNGRRRELSFFERVFAFGVSTQPVPPSRYSARIAGYRERDAVIEVGADGKPRALMTSGQRTFRVVYAYAQAEERRIIPKIHYIDIHGIDVASGEAVRERVRLDM